MSTGVTQGRTSSLACRALLALILGWSGGCASVSDSDWSAQRSSARSLAPGRPLVVVPGILGSRLVHANGNAVAWGAGIDVFFPRDKAYELALPIAGADGTGAIPLRPDGVVETVKLGPYTKKVYRRLTQYFEARGYQLGRLSDPKPGDTLFLFDYDFRKSNLQAVAKLRSELAHLRRARGLEELHFDLLCQSNGGYICRYLVRFGAEFDPVYNQRDSVQVGPPRGLMPRRIALAGTANAGALRILREFRDGRYFVKGVGRWFSAEILFAMRPLFDDLPWPANDDAQGSLFIDEQGTPMQVDLYSAEDWQRYGFGVFGAKAEERLSTPAARSLFGSHDKRLAYVKERLAASRSFQQRLATDAGLSPATIGALDPLLFMVQGGTTDTPARAALVERDGEWQTVFMNDPLTETLPSAVTDKLMAAGDGHATVTSQNSLSPLERSWLVEPATVYTEGTHFNLILSPKALSHLVDFFLTDF